VNAQRAQLFGDRASLAHLRHESFAFVLRPHGRSTTSGRPHWSYQRAHYQSSLSDVVRQTLQVVIGRIDIRVGQGKEQIDTVELDAIDFGLLRQIEHGIQADRRFRIRTLADQPRPHGVMQLGKRVRSVHAA
jgi:hypothetical protein